jgi:predicted RNA binding protein YcfA (HicA-like mRNA interferase family)
MYSPKVPKDLRKAVRSATEAGWVLSTGRAKHTKLTSPDGSYATPIPGSTNNRGLIKKILSELRKRGVDC